MRTALGTRLHSTAHQPQARGPHALVGVHTAAYAFTGARLPPHQQPGLAHHELVPKEVAVTPRWDRARVGEHAERLRPVAEVLAILRPAPGDVGSMLKTMACKGPNGAGTSSPEIIMFRHVQGMPDLSNNLGRVCASKYPCLTLHHRDLVGPVRPCRILLIRCCMSCSGCMRTSQGLGVLRPSQEPQAPPPAAQPRVADRSHAHIMPAPARLICFDTACKAAWPAGQCQLAASA